MFWHKNTRYQQGHIPLFLKDFLAVKPPFQTKPANYMATGMLVRCVRRGTSVVFLAPANDDNFWIEVLSGGLPDAPPSPSHPISSGFQPLCLEVDDVDETLAALREKGIQVAQEPFNVPPIGKRCGFITDLYGNTIEFAANLK